MTAIIARIVNRTTYLLGVSVALLAFSPAHSTTILSGTNCGATTLTTTGTATGQVIIGCVGTGSLEVNANATGNGITTVNANGTGSISIVSGLGNSSGSILVNGNGTAGSATLNSFHSIQIGFPSGGIGGTGSLTVLNGGLVQVTGTDPFSGYGITIGNSDSSGEVTVDGANSVLTSRGAINVGAFDNTAATLTISNGGLVQAAGSSANDNRVLIGTGDGPGARSALVTGSGSTLVATGVILGNGSGTSGGSLTVEDGATISIQSLGSGFYDAGLSVGAATSSTVLVTGPGSNIQIDPITVGFMAGAEVNIGGFGAGTLVVDDGATVDATGANVHVSGGPDGSNTSSPGLLTVKNFSALIANQVTVYANGTVNGNGTITADVFLSGGTVAPGNSPGTLTIDGDFVADATSQILIEIAGTGAGEFDVLEILGTAWFDPGSSIALVFTNGFAPSANQVFDFLLAGSFGSDMDLVNFSILGLESGFQYDIGFGNEGVFTLTAINDGIAVVPVAPAAWLFGSALGVMGWMRRRVQG